MKSADIAAAGSVEALKDSHEPFDPAVGRLRPHPGIGLVCSNMRQLLRGSEIEASHLHCDKVQDVYSLRAVPQVHGASRGALAHMQAVVERELNAVTDNPLVLWDEQRVISAGNFHVQPLALAADYLAIVISEIASISERRIEQMLNPALSRLPAFLAEQGGLYSGLMISQYAAASLVSENKVLSHPASVDSIPTSANQEDHVSIGYHCLQEGAFDLRKCKLGVVTHRSGLGRSGVGLPPTAKAHGRGCGGLSIRVRSGGSLGPGSLLQAGARAT